MKVVDIVILFLLSYDALAQRATKFNYRVPGEIPVIKQPKKMDCWITVTTMMLSWKDNKKYSVGDIAKRFGQPWAIYYDTNAGLSEADQATFIKKVGLKEEPPANYLLEAYLDFLKKHGPVWITTGDGFSAHAKLLIGIEGSGSYDSTDLVFIDPAEGKVVSKNALKFMKEFEEEAFVANEEKWERLRIQIYHF